MKIELNIDTTELVAEITRSIRAAIKPMLAKCREEDDQIFSVKALAGYLGVSNQWVYERVRLHEIPFIKMGKFPRFKKADIDRWLDSLQTPALHLTSRPFKVKK
ncbi:MAG: excisionase family DNA-binding protein [Nitrospiria bacterium]